jgi:hypothetical protein
VVSKRRLCAALVLVGAGLVPPGALAAADAERKLSPKALYEALSKVPKGKAVLPNGYQSPTIGRVPLTPNAKRHHAVGAVGIDLAKPGTLGAGILFIVFPTRADALADWNEGVRRLPKTRLRPPSFFPKPSVMVNASVTLGNAPSRPIGTTRLAFVVENIIIEVDTSSTSSTTHGDVLGAIALAQFAGRHLNSVTRAVAPVKPALPALPAPPAPPVL